MRNPTLLQCFHWYYPEGGKLWPELAERADGFNDIGINMVWLPPAYKGANSILRQPLSFQIVFPHIRSASISTQKRPSQM